MICGVCNKELFSPDCRCVEARFYKLPSLRADLDAVVSDPDAYAQDMLNRAVIPIREITITSSGSGYRTPAFGTFTTQASPKAKPEPTPEDKALHRALSRSHGTFSRENQCGWVGEAE